jgi:hypothetical protein
MLVVFKSDDDPTVTQIVHPGVFSRVLSKGRRYRIERAFGSYQAHRPDGFELFTDDRCEYAGVLVKQLPPCDVFNLHWVSGLLDYASFFRQVPSTRPVVWTLHDMNAITGGCHYDLSCNRYIDGCRACPQLGSADETDLSAKIWKRKKKIFSQVDSSRLNIVAPSQWLAREARKSPLLGRFSSQGYSVRARC